MNLTISTVATGMMNVSAAEEYSSEAAFETYAEESAQTYAEDTVAPEQVISETDAAYYSSDIGSEVTDTAVVSAETDTTASTVSADIETTAVPVPEGENQTEIPTEAPTETPTETTTETPAISSTEIETTAETADSALSTEESSQIAETENTTEVNETETEEVSTEEETSEEESEEESTEEETTEEKEIVLFQGRESDFILHLNQLKFYDNTDNANKVTIQSAKQLILLSYCDPNELHTVNIVFNMSGVFDLTENSKIAPTEDLSDYLKSVDESDNLAVNDSTEQETINQSENIGNDEKSENSEIFADDPQVKTSITVNRELTYQGMGTKEYPYQGTISGQFPSAVIADFSFFGGLSSLAKVSMNSNTPFLITWSGNKNVPVLAETYVFESADPDGHSLPISVTGDQSATMGNLIGTITATDDTYKNEILKIDSSVVTYGSNSVTVTSDTQNTGLICNVLEKGGVCLDGYAFPNNYTVTSNSEYIMDNASAAGNAGGVIGVMKTGTVLKINSNVTITGATVTSKTGNAGGLVGLMEDNTKIETGNTASVNLTAQIEGKKSAGGLVGAATNVLFNDSDLLSIITVNASTVKSSENAGGFIGAYTLDASKFGGESLNNAEGLSSLPDNIVITTPTLTVTDNGVAGGYFGSLDLNGKQTYTISGADSNDKKEMNPTYAGCVAEAIGAIAGKVTSDTIASTLLIQNVSVNATNSSGTGIQYHGGLIGEVGNSTKAVYLNVSDVNITVNNPTSVDQIKKTDTYGFGGIAGILAQGSILQSSNVTVSSTGEINCGGGLVGYAEKSVINVLGITDLSGVNYAGGSGKGSNSSKWPKTGWLVGRQESALIYANGDGNGNGWSYIRGKENTRGKQAMNDIGNYGQIIRLNPGDSASKLSYNLIEIDSEHKINYSATSNITLDNNMIQIGSVDAFAMLSIYWNTRGNFGSISGITGDFSSSNLQSMNITLSADIDLTGSGISGLTRDGIVKDNIDVYKGIFDGKNKTITLAIGETFGFKQSETLAAEKEDGYGEVISVASEYHGRQGLFAVVGGNAQFKDLIIAGNINISNAGWDILAGGVAGEVAKDAKCIIENVKVGETINADCANSENVVVGGFFGGSYDVATVTIQSDDSGNLSEAKATIQLENCMKTTSDTKINAGGVIGEIGEKAFTFEANGLKVGGSIMTDAKKRAYVGGLIGVIKANGDEINHWITIKNVEFNDFGITAQIATEVCGGLLGSIWQNVEVYFGKKDSVGTDDSIKLEVKNAIIDAKNAARVGGLAYRSSGKWEIQDYGIKLESFTINAKKDVGLLVCRGEKATDIVAGSSRVVGALYLCTTKYWNTSYQISENDVKISSTNAGAFDEFVAYTTPTAPEIVDSGKNGVISIATEDIIADGVTGRVGVDPAKECTTYRNRTTYGQNQKTNAYSRYYYDLDQCLTDVGNSSANSKIDTPQELLLYSVYKYACSNIKNYFVSNKNTDTKLDAGSWVNIQNVESLDMSKYSYYPIKIIEVIHVKVSNIKLKFNNENIETQEKYNKSTQGTDEEHTQHYAMHCGLFLYFQGSELIVKNVKFSGSIGQVYESNAGRDSSNKQYAVKGSGVLVSSFASGNASIDGTTSRYLNIRITDITLNGLKVTDCKESYAPLLINNIGSRYSTNYIYGYTKLTVDTVTVSGYSTETSTAVASSLIGNVGDSKSKSITMTFNHIVLPDKKAADNGGIFSHATLLERFAYASDDNTSGATYNFLRSEDWNGEKHDHKVTYGYEITKTTEFEGLQNWYYDESTYKMSEGLVYDDLNNRDKFDSSNYLRYVSTPYGASTCMHEIKVNQRVVDITTGCGTYEHPYRITKESEMNILSDYMATGNPSKDWRVTITENQTEVHTGAEKDYTSDQDITYQYDGSTYWEPVKKKGNGVSEKWEVIPGTKLEKNFMRYYLLNAYYDIRGTVVQGNTVADTNEATQVADGEDNSASNPELILNNFKGFGTRDNPFRGVITSTNNTTLVLKGAETGNGLIPYSYGSVVKNLTILYSGSAGKTLTYTDQDTVAYVPSAYFGGAIGCVLGGDNIIDNVTVSVADVWKITLDGNKSHLIQIGGYVGSIAGGGVIFRDMTDRTGLTADWIESVSDISSYANLYVNPYVGRVLDGYAFYEKKSAEKNVVDSLNNTNKNYTINTLKEGACVSATDNSITVNNAQGLLILSAIVNSGAASDGSSRAYSKTGDSDGQAITAGTKNYAFGGKYGKVRNALYSAIGSGSDDATTSIMEDRKVPGADNLPYLIKAYCGGNKSIFSSLTAGNLEIVLSNKVDTFDMTSYQKGYQGIGARYVSNAVQGTNGSNNPEGVIPELKSFNGNGKTVTMSMQVREYADDDFHAASVGGIFNVLRVSGKGTISNVAIGSSTAQTSTEQEGAEQTLTDQTETKKTQSTISLQYYNSNGQPCNAPTAWSTSKEVGVGGFAGSLVGYTDNDTNRDITIEKIQLNGLQITSTASAGGIVGNIGRPTVNTQDRQRSTDISVLLQPKNRQITYGTAFNECSYTDITVSGKYAAGGLVGYIGNKNQNPRSSVKGFSAPSTTSGENTSETLKVTNTGESSIISAIDNSSWAGGLFGYVDTRMFINMNEDGSRQTTQVILKDVTVKAGTAVGGCIGYINVKCYGIHNVTVKGTAMNDSSAANATDSQIAGGTQIVSTGVTTGDKAVNFYAGGIVGFAKGAYQSWTPDWNYNGGIINSSIENVTINIAEIANKHDYTVGRSDGIKSNYIAGGIVGQAAGGLTKIDGCTVTTSKIYGSVASGIAGQTDSVMQFDNCKVVGVKDTNDKTIQTEIKGFSTAGGILGFWTKQGITIRNCKVQYLNIEGKDWGVGALVGDAENNKELGTLYVFNCSAQDSVVNAAGNDNDGGGRWPTAGGIIGNLRNAIKASNILFSNIELQASDGAKVNNNVTKRTKGLLFGSVAKTDTVISIAGISIQNIPDENSNDKLAGNVSENTELSKTYIAFADYFGTAIPEVNKSEAATDTEADTDTQVGDDLLGYGSQTNVESPYVVISPKSSLALYESSSDSQPKYLYGDGVSWKIDGDGKTFTTTAQRILASEKKTSYKYNSSSWTLETSAISTYNTNQNEKAIPDFPVIEITGGDTTVVENYLNIVTNGGFSSANNLNTSDDIHVTATTDVYEYHDGHFIKSDATPAFKVEINSTNKHLTFSTTTDYDNGENRFTLLTVTFTENGAGENEKYSYNVFVPILVRRMLEIDFSATLSYGTNFNKANYENLTSHVLESFGNSVSAYLTYTYNSKEGSYVDYGWESYVNAGGNVADPMKKVLDFQQGKIQLPVGTQLSLVDGRDGKVYYHTVDEQDKDNKVAFDRFEDSAGNAYQAPSIAELLNAQVQKDSTGAFIEVDKNGKPLTASEDDQTQYDPPTVRIKTSNGYQYYRQASGSEVGEYKITVAESAIKDGTKSKMEEMYYLVINVPKETQSDVLNGALSMEIENDIPHTIYYRTIQGGEDRRENTASTYQISTGYSQKLNEHSSITEISKEMNAASTIMKVDVVDTITFPNNQVFLDENTSQKDELYFKIVGRLNKMLDGSVSAEQFPSGTTGEAKFYVYSENGTARTYYTYNETGWSTRNEEAVAVEYPWTSEGGNMELVLSSDGSVENAISLQEVRKKVKDANSAAVSSTFYVEVKMDANLPASGLNVIPESDMGSGSTNLPVDYVKLTYSSQLSAEKSSLNYSNNRALCSNTRTAYYREEPAGAKLTYEADTIDQLGINLLDPQYLDVSKEHALIDTTAVYSLASMKNLDDALKNSTGIRFTLTLAPKNTTSGNTEEYVAALTNAIEYLDVELKSKDSGDVAYDSGTWSWTVPQSTYWANDNIKTDSVFDGSVLTQAIQLKVNVANVELNNHYYSNYKVVLTAEIVKNDKDIIYGTHQNDNIIYTLARINMDFVDGPASGN